MSLDFLILIHQLCPHYPLVNESMNLALTRQKGQAMAEMLVSIPLLTFLAAGIIHFSFLL